MFRLSHGEYLSMQRELMMRWFRRWCGRSRDSLRRGRWFCVVLVLLTILRILALLFFFLFFFLLPFCFLLLLPFLGNPGNLFWRGFIWGCYWRRWRWCNRRRETRIRQVRFAGIYPNPCAFRVNQVIGLIPAYQSRSFESTTVVALWHM